MRSPDALCTSTSIRTLLLAMSLTTVSATVSAQPIVNPRLIEFIPSAQHDQLLPDGRPALVRYELAFVLSGSYSPFLAMDIGKPALQPDGMLRYDFGSRIAAWPYPDIDCAVLVTAIGSDGSTISAASNTFVFHAASFGNVAPSIALATPTNGAAFDFRSFIKLSAAVNDVDGVVKTVRFFVDGALVGTRTAAPFEVTWRARVAGPHTITAIATDNSGSSTTATAVISVRSRR
jgi:Bacterial Ig domain